MSRRDAGRPRGVLVEHLVLECVLDVLASEGVDQLSVERVAVAAQVNKTSIYRRWPTRQALLAAALEYVWRGLSFEIQDTGSLAGDVAALGQSLARLLSSREGQALGRAAMAGSNPEMAALARRAMTERAGTPAAQMVRKAMARKEWRADASPEVALGLLVGAYLHRAFLECQPFDAFWQAQVVTLFCHAVEPK